MVYSGEGERRRREGAKPPYGSSEGSVPVWLRYLDLVVLVAALPVFLLGEFPMAGYLVGGGAWIAQRLLQAALAQRARDSKDPRTVVGLTVASMILRGWLVAAWVFLVGVNDNEAGLAAAVLVIALFTVYFTMQFALRPMERPR
jgi:hypothetical protein